MESFCQFQDCNPKERSLFRSCLARSCLTWGCQHRWRTSSIQITAGQEVTRLALSPIQQNKRQKYHNKRNCSHIHICMYTYICTCSAHLRSPRDHEEDDCNVITLVSFYSSSSLGNTAISDTVGQEGEALCSQWGMDFIGNDKQLSKPGTRLICCSLK